MMLRSSGFEPGMEGNLSVKIRNLVQVVDVEQYLREHRDAT